MTTTATTTTTDPRPEVLAWIAAERKREASLTNASDDWTTPNEDGQTLIQLAYWLARHRVASRWARFDRAVPIGDHMAELAQSVVASAWEHYSDHNRHGVKALSQAINHGIRTTWRTEMRNVARGETTFNESSINKLPLSMTEYRGALCVIDDREIPDVFGRAGMLLVKAIIAGLSREEVSIMFGVKESRVRRVCQAWRTVGLYRRLSECIDDARREPMSVSAK